MKKIREILNFYTNYQTIDSFEKILESSFHDEFYYIISSPSGLFYNNIFKDLFPVALIDLLNPFTNVNLHRILYIFSKTKHENIKISSSKQTLDLSKFTNGKLPLINFIKNLKITKTPDEKLKEQVSKFSIMKAYPSFYESYLNKIDNFLSSEKIPDDDIYFYYNVIKSEDFDYNKLNTKYYTKAFQFLKKNIKNERIKSLDEVAHIEVIYKNRSKNEKKLCLSENDLNIPIVLNKIYKKQPEYIGQTINGKTIQVKKNDILLSNSKFYFISENPEEQIFYNFSGYVITPKLISPEYLFIYLNSDIVNQYLSALNSSISTPYNCTTLKDLSKIPIIIPMKSPEYYRNLFVTLSNRNVDYSKLYETYFKNLNSLSVHDYYDSILNYEIIHKLKSYKQNKVYELIKSDIKELNTCYSVKAYKASLILAGSILEAFLIDWLSEIKNTDFFNENNHYKVQKKNKDGSFIFDKNGNPLYKDADLIDYIAEIKTLKAPDWEDAYLQATEIRKKRNNVHAKICINKDDVNEKTCKKIIQYLEYVINTRWNMKI